MNVIFEPVLIPEYFDNEVFNWPTEYTSGSEPLVLNGQVSDSDVGLFISSLLSFNDSINLDNDFLKSLIIEDEMALCGGIQVRCDKKTISPSCCCDIQSIKSWKDAIINKHSIWMGHDPSPELHFDEDRNVVLLWSDEKDQIGRFPIQFTQNEVFEGIEKVFEQLKHFVNRIGEWSTRYTSLDRYVVEDSFSTYLMKPLLK